MALFSCDLAVLPGYPPDLVIDLHSMPAVESGSNIFQLCARRDRSDGAEVGTVSVTDDNLVVCGVMITQMTTSLVSCCSCS